MKSNISWKISIAFALAICSATTAADFATLKGQFLYGKEGTSIPTASKLNITKDVQVCGKHQLFDEQLVVNEENRGISNVVLWAFKPKVVHESYKETANATVEINNKDCRFDPHVIAVRTGQTLRVGNPDPIGHNSMIGFLKNPPVNPIIPANGEVKFDLKKAELIPVKISCSIHPWMQGIVMVQDHPYVAITDEDGKFELANLPAGDLTLKVWHEKSGYIQSVNLDGKTASWKKGRYKLNLKKDEEHTYVIDPKTFE